MTTYGPSTLTLAERLRAADMVARVKTAELVDVAVDDLSEGRRELGTFRLEIDEILLGEEESTCDVLVVRAADGPWPIPADGAFVALLQRDSDRRYVLVHDSAFPISGKGVRVDAAAGLGGRSRAEFIPFKEVVAEIRRLAEQERADAEQFAARETKRYSAERPAPQEAPGDGLGEWLDLDHSEAGRAAAPDAAPPAKRGRSAETSG